MESTRTRARSSQPAASRPWWTTAISALRAWITVRTDQGGETAESPPSLDWGSSSFTNTSRRPNVLVLVDSFPVLSQTFVNDHLSGLVQNGVHVTVVARNLDDSSSIFPSVIRGRIQVLQSPRASMRSFGHLLRIIVGCPLVLSSRLLLTCAWHGARLSCLQISRLDWDVVHAHFANNGLSAALTNRRWKHRLVVNFHGYDATTIPKQFGWRPYRKILGNCDAVAHSSFIADLLEKNTRLKVHRVSMGVDRSRFIATPRADYWSSPLKLLFVGRLVEQKGAETALHALAELRKNAPHLNPRLSIVGAGPLELTLRQQIEAFGLREVVDGPAPADHDLVADIISGSDILIMPSRISSDGSQEAFGRIAAEAMTCGIPVIGCPSGGLPSTIGQGGIVASGFDARSVVDAILFLMDSATPKTWRHRALLQASSYQIEKMNEDYLTLVLEIAQRRRAP